MRRRGWKWSVYFNFLLQKVLKEMDWNFDEYWLVITVKLCLERAIFIYNIFQIFENEQYKILSQKSYTFFYSE